MARLFVPQVVVTCADGKSPIPSPSLPHSRGACGFPKALGPSSIALSQQTPVKRMLSSKLNQSMRRQLPLKDNSVVVCATTSGANTITGFRVSLTPEEARQSLRLIEIPNPDGPLSVIVVEAVAIDSRAQKEGVKPGQRVLAVSHPVERDQMWELRPGALITRVKDIFRVTRSPEVELVFTEDSVAEAWYEEQQRIQKEAEAAADQADSGASTLDRTLSSPLLNSIAGGGTGGASVAENGGGEEEAGLSVAEQLERQVSKDMSEEQRAVQAYKRRIARRRERYELESERDDGPFFLFVFAFFAAPAGIILGIAAATGYLDTLQNRF